MRNACCSCDKCCKHDDAYGRIPVLMVGGGCSSDDTANLRACPCDSLCCDSACAVKRFGPGHINCFPGLSMSHHTFNSDWLLPGVAGACCRSVFGAAHRMRIVLMAVPLHLAAGAVPGH